MTGHDIESTEEIGNETTPLLSVKVETTPTGHIPTSSNSWSFARSIGNAFKTGLSYTPYIFPIVGPLGAAVMDAADMYMGLKAEGAKGHLKTRITLLSFASSASVFLLEAFENFPQTMETIKNTSIKELLYPTKAKVATVFLTVLSYFADLTETDFFVGSLPKEEENFPNLSPTQLKGLIAAITFLVMVNTTLTESIDTYKFLVGKNEEENQEEAQSNFAAKLIKAISLFVGCILGFFNAVQDALKSLVSMADYFKERNVQSVELLGGMIGMAVFKMVSRFLFMGILSIKTINNTLTYFAKAIIERKFEPLKLLTSAAALYMSYILAINDRKLEEDFGHDITKEIGDILNKNLENHEYTDPAFYYLSWILFAQSMIISSGGYYHALTIGEKLLGMAATKLDNATGNKVSNTTQWMMKGLCKGYQRLNSKRKISEERATFPGKEGGSTRTISLTEATKAVRSLPNLPSTDEIARYSNAAIYRENAGQPIPASKAQLGLFTNRSYTPGYTIQDEKRSEYGYNS